MFQLKLKQEDHLLMVRALANVLLLPWPAIPDQKWDDRARHLTKFLRDLTEPFRALRNVPDFATNRELQQQGELEIVQQNRLQSRTSRACTGRVRPDTIKNYSGDLR